MGHAISTGIFPSVMAAYIMLFRIHRAGAGMFFFYT